MLLATINPELASHVFKNSSHKNDISKEVDQRQKQATSKDAAVLKSIAKYNARCIADDAIVLNPDEEVGE